jgi:hypothetical protein
VTSLPGTSAPPPPPPPQHVPEELEGFIFTPDQFLKDDVPRDIDPLEIELLVKQRINNKTPHRALEQLFKAVDYYDATEVVPHLRKLLTKHENGPDDLHRAAIITRIVALVGNPEEYAKAKDYFDYLVGKADTQVVLERLVALYEILGPGADPKALKAKLEAREKALAKDKDKDAAAKATYNEAERLLNFTLNRATRANDIKKKTLAIKDRAARITDEIKTYLAMQHGFGEYLPAFAARRLRRETWAAEPEQQVARTVDPVLRKQVADAFRAIFPAIRTLKLTDEEKEFIMIAALDANMFFGGTLTEPEKKLVDEKGAKQKNILTKRKFH